MNKDNVSMKVGRFWNGIQRNHVGVQARLEVIGFDTETCQGIVYYTGLYDGQVYQDYYGLEDHASWFLDRLVEKASHKKDRTICVFAHYLSFDLGVLFYDYIKPFGTMTAPNVIRFSILKSRTTVELYMGRPCFAKIKRGHQTITLIDSWAFLKCPLSKALQMFGGAIQKQEKPHGLGKRIISYKRLRAYAESDVKGVHLLGQKIVEWHQRYDIRMTISGPMMAGRIFRHCFVKDDFKWCSSVNRYVSMLSYHGGKNTFKGNPGWYERCYELDIRSAYPEAMADLPDFHDGRFQTVKKFVSRWGIYRVSGMLKPCPWGCIFSDDYKKLHGMVHDVWTTGYELEEALHAGEIQITDLVGIVWIPSTQDKEGTSSPFKAYVEHFYKLKEASKVESERSFYKLCLNALYGKFLNRIENDHGEKIGGSMFYPFIGTLITGFVNARMHQLEHRYQSIHTATDSIKTFSPPCVRDLGPEMGKLKIEIYGDCLILRNKLYVHYSKDEQKRKVGLHGFHGTADELLDLYEHGELYYTVKRLVHWKEAFRRGLRPGSEIKVPLELKI